jgi:hypothetical protein
MRVRRPHLRRDTSGYLPRGIPRARMYPAGPRTADSGSIRAR